MVIYPQILLFVLLYVHQSPDFLVRILQIAVSLNALITNMETKQEIGHVCHTALSLLLLMDQYKQYGSLKSLSIFVSLIVKMILGVMCMEDLLAKLSPLTVSKVNMPITVLIYAFHYAHNSKTILAIQARGYALTVALLYLPM